MELAVKAVNKRAVMVFGVQAFGNIGVVRSLGRAGYIVHACSEDPSALGLCSNFATRAVIHPPASGDGFIRWLEEYVRNHDIGMIIPAGAVMQNLFAAGSELIGLVPMPQSREAIEVGFNKAKMMQALVRSGDSRIINTLPPWLVAAKDAVPALADIAALGAPFFVKADCNNIEKSRAGLAGNVVHKANSPEQALELVQRLLIDYNEVLIQGYVPGKGAGANFLVWDGEIKASFLNICDHESPHTGGTCSLRSSWWHPEMLEDARRTLNHLNWRGVAMLEYRWDEDSGRHYFIEGNMRFWGALHLAVFAGVDFPRLLADCFFGDSVEPQHEYADVSARVPVDWEIGYVVSRLKDRNVSLAAKMWSVVEYFLLFLHPRIRSDLNFPGDRMLYWRRLARFLFRTAPAAPERKRGWRWTDFLSAPHRFLRRGG